MDIKLRFVNQSMDGHQSEVVIYQKNLISDMASLTMAWKVIRYCGYGCYHPFVYSTDLEICVCDEHGNFSPRISAHNGELLSLELTAQGGRRLRRAGKAAAANEVNVVNGMGRGAVDVCAYRAGRLVERLRAVAPGQQAVFRYQPALWVGVASQVVQGTALDSAVVSDMTTELSLLGMASADIVMSGGGVAEDAVPYAFRLENVAR